MSLENHPDALIKATYQGVENAIRTPAMLTYTSTALIGLLLSLTSVSDSKTINSPAQLQSAAQTLEISYVVPSRRVSHRGSGRIGFDVVS
jgi:hypothetical protein